MKRKVRQVRRDVGVRQSWGGRSSTHEERPQGVDQRVRPREGVSLTFVLHPTVLEPDLETGGGETGERRFGDEEK